MAFIMNQLFLFRDSALFGRGAATSSGDESAFGLDLLDALGVGGTVADLVVVLVKERYQPDSELPKGSANVSVVLEELAFPVLHSP